MSGVYKSKPKPQETKNLNSGKCDTCRKEGEMFYKLHTSHKFFCSKKCRDIHFNGYPFPDDSFKIKE